MRRALGEFVIAGELTTNLEFHRWIDDASDVLSQATSTPILSTRNIIRTSWRQSDDEVPELAAILAAAMAAQRRTPITATARGAHAVPTAKSRFGMADARPARHAAALGSAESH